MNARMATCRDLTKNEADLKKIIEVFLILQNCASPTSLFLSCFPGPGRKTARQATTDLHTLIYGYVETRRRAQELTSDAIDILITDGETTQNIVGVGPATNVAWGFPKSDPTFLVRHGDAFRWRH